MMQNALEAAVKGASCVLVAWVYWQDVLMKGFVLGHPIAGNIRLYGFEGSENVGKSWEADYRFCVWFCLRCFASEPDMMFLTNEIGQIRGII